MIIKNKYNVSVLSFKIMDSSGKQVYELPIKNEDYDGVSCECIVYLPDDFINNFSNAEKVFFHLLTYAKVSFNRPLLYQENAISVKDIPSTGLIRLNFKMNFPTPYIEKHADNGIVKLQFSPYKLIGYSFSVSDQDLDNQISNDNEDEGIFFNTVVPSGVIDNES